MEGTIRLGNQNLTLHQIKVTLKNLSEQYEKSFDKNPEGDSRILEQMKKYQNARKQLLKYNITAQQENKPKQNEEKQIVSNSQKEVKKQTKEVKTYQKLQNIATDKIKISENIETRQKTIPNTYTNNDLVIDTMHFDGKLGEWIIEYHENAMTNIEKYSVNSKYISECNEVYERLRKKHDKKHLNAVNIDKLNILSIFDKEHGTNFSKKYLEGNCDYISTYNLRKLFSNKELSLKDKSQILINANKQKNQKNTKVLNPKYGKLVLTTLCLSILLASASVTNIVLKKTKSPVGKGVYISSEDNYQKLEKGIPVKDSKQIAIENTNDKLIDKDKAINTTKENCPKLKDKYELKNVELLFSSVKDVRSVNTDDLNCDYYEPCLIAIVDPNKIDQDEKNNGILDIKPIEEVENTDLDSLVKNYRDEYCNDKIRVVVNFNGYDKLGNTQYKEIGWTEISNIKNAKVKNTTTTSLSMSYMEQKSSEYNAVIAARTPKVLKKMR